MSTKDLIDRLSRSGRGTPRGSTSTEGTSDPSEVRKRINDRVIVRRRRRAKAAAPKAETEALRPDIPKRAAAHPRAVPAAAKEAPASGTPASPAPREVAVASTVASARPEAPAAKAVEPGTAPARKAALAQPAAQAQATTDAQPPAEAHATTDAQPPAEAQATTDAQPTVHGQATAQAASTQPQPSTAEAAPARPGSATTEPPSTESAAKEAGEPLEARPTIAAQLASELPRADEESRQNAAAKPFPGLGVAVVKPPPGYDPNDPTGNRRRAERAAERSKMERTGRSWRDERSTGTAYSADEDRRSARRKSRRRVERYMDEIPMGRHRRRSKKKVSGAKQTSPQAKAIKRRIPVDESITVSNLARAMSVKTADVIKTLLGMGQMATVNDLLDFETAQIVAAEFEHEVVNASFQEEEHLISVQDEEADLKPRPPVVTIMGHVDHGKTSLLDKIRSSSVATGEAGGITQHIGAYQVEREGKLITFIDTPGHEAFTEMRARGAQVTDIVVLVVAADDGVMSQTIEAINHSKAAGVQILVAINKIDKANANPERAKQQLMEHGLVPEEYGGDTVFVPVSALTGQGINDLLDAILLLAEVGDYRANPNRHAEGHVLEARLERGRGAVATILVQAGTLKQGDSLVLGTTWGRVRAMTDHTGKRLKSAGPSTPVEIIGLHDLPVAGDAFTVVGSDKDAKALAEHRLEKARQAELNKPSGVTLEELLARAQAENEEVTLKLVIKADVAGTLEALKQAIGKIAIPATEVKILHSGVGAVSESDVNLAHTYGGVVLGFNVRPDAKARQAMDEYNVEVRTYNVIYDVIEDVQKALLGLLGPSYEEKVQGTAEIRQTFQVPKVGTVAGCFVTDGKIARNHQVRLLRDGKIVWEGRLASLRRFKNDIREVEKGYECGMNLDGYNDIKVGDVIETFTREEVQPTLR